MRVAGWSSSTRYVMGAMVSERQKLRGCVGAVEQVIGDLLSHEPGGVGSASTYAALMAACEKAGQWDLALVLFEKMSSQVQTDQEAVQAGSFRHSCVFWV